jgi:hypothetical protein
MTRGVRFVAVILAFLCGAVLTVAWWHDAEGVQYQTCVLLNWMGLMSDRPWATLHDLSWHGEHLQYRCRLTWGLQQNVAFSPNPLVFHVHGRFWDVHGNELDGQDTVLILGKDEDVNRPVLEGRARYVVVPEGAEYMAVEEAKWQSGRMQLPRRPLLETGEGMP